MLDKNNSLKDYMNRLEAWKYRLDHTEHLQHIKHLNNWNLKCTIIIHLNIIGSL